ncbi:MAG TPA: TMEM175 family protein [Arachidicoccus sp.]
MSPERLTAFSDGVIAIIITIMVLEIKVPREEDGGTFRALVPLLPTFLAYALSYAHVGIYWNNHHHVFKLVKRINGKALWANLILLFFLSLVPVATAWMGEHYKSSAPVALYGIVMLFCAMAYRYLIVVLIKCAKDNSLLAEGIGNDFKGITSVVIYLIGIGVSFWLPLAGIITYVFVACLWLIPDKRLEARFMNDEE